MRDHVKEKRQSRKRFRFVLRVFSIYLASLITSVYTHSKFIELVFYDPAIAAGLWTSMVVTYWFYLSREETTRVESHNRQILVLENPKVELTAEQQMGLGIMSAVTITLLPFYLVMPTISWFLILLGR